LPGIEAASLLLLIMVVGNSNVFMQCVCSAYTCINAAMSATACSFVLQQAVVARNSHLTHIRHIMQTHNLLLLLLLLQAGVLAAAGLEAWVNNFTGLRSDHDNARALARALAAVPGVQVKSSAAQDEALLTNMVYFRLAAAESANSSSTSSSTARSSSSSSGTADRTAAFVAALAQRGVLVSGGYGAGGGTMRAVTHLDVGQQDLQRAVEAVKAVLHEQQQQQ
jgi:threonine aldolase